MIFKRHLNALVFIQPRYNAIYLCFFVCATAAVRQLNHVAGKKTMIILLINVNVSKMK